VPQAFTELYEQLAPVAFNLACRILRDAAEAEDVLQQAFLSLWQHVDEYDADKGRISTWFYVFVRNRCIDVIRHRRKEKSVSIEPNGDEPALEFTDHAAGVEKQVYDKEKKRVIGKALASLPEPQKRVIEAAYFEGRTQQEIADQFNEPLGTVKTRMRLGLMKLTEILKGQVHVL
jgi:RNA polymerase sigma-70 factor (ECF subfamily)